MILCNQAAVSTPDQQTALLTNFYYIFLTINVPYTVGSRTHSNFKSRIFRLHIKWYCLLVMSFIPCVYAKPLKISRDFSNLKNWVSLLFSTKS